MSMIPGLLFLAFGIVAVLVMRTLSVSASYSHLPKPEAQPASNAPPDPDIPPAALLPTISHSGEELEAMRQYYLRRERREGP